jgi:hypothetical protein
MHTARTTRLTCHGATVLHPSQCQWNRRRSIRVRCSTVLVSESNLRSWLGFQYLVMPIFKLKSWTCQWTWTTPAIMILTVRVSGSGWTRNSDPGQTLRHVLSRYLCVLVHTMLGHYTLSTSIWMYTVPVTEVHWQTFWHHLPHHTFSPKSVPGTYLHF